MCATLKCIHYRHSSGAWSSKSPWKCWFTASHRAPGWAYLWPLSSGSEGQKHPTREITGLTTQCTSVSSDTIDTFKSYWWRRWWVPKMRRGMWDGKHMKLLHLIIECIFWEAPTLLLHFSFFHFRKHHWWRRCIWTLTLVQLVLVKN